MLGEMTPLRLLQILLPMSFCNMLKKMFPLILKDMLFPRFAHQRLFHGVIKFIIFLLDLDLLMFNLKKYLLAHFKGNFSYLYIIYVYIE